jgi:hypothetical protein
MDLLIPLVWATNLTLISYFLLKLRRDFELSAKRKAFEEEQKERRRQAKEAKIRSQNQQQQQHEVLPELSHVETNEPSPPVALNESNSSQRGLSATNENPV